MKGVIFDLLQHIVTEDHGDDAWDHTLDDAGVPGAYTAVGNYHDSEFTALLEHLPGDAGTTNDRLRWFGRRAMPALAARYPVFFEGHRDIVTFLPTLNDVIHAEVRKLYPDAGVPDFATTVTGDGTVVLEYRSARRLCALAEGFILGAADHFGQVVDVEQRTCMLRGATHCTLACSVRVAAAHG